MNTKDGFFMAKILIGVSRVDISISEMIFSIQGSMTWFIAMILHFFRVIACKMKQRVKKVVG